MKNTQIAIIGLGYVGLPLALLATKKRYSVTGIDLDSQKVRKINNKISPFKDEEIQTNLTKYPFTASTNTNSRKKI